MKCKIITINYDYHKSFKYKYYKLKNSFESKPYICYKINISIN